MEAKTHNQAQALSITALGKALRAQYPSWSFPSNYGAHPAYHPSQMLVKQELVHLSTRPSVGPRWVLAVAQLG